MSRPARIAAPATVHDRTAEFLTPVRRRRIPLITPEGVQLDVEIASLGDRAGAFLIDLTLIFVTNVALLLLVALAVGLGWHTHILQDHGRVRVVFALTGLIAFLIRSLYFVRFELVWQGATPGKRLNNLRVIDRHGRPLRPSAVIARNVTREAEIFVPLGAFFAIGHSGLTQSALALWLVLLACVPLFTRERLRAGDMLAGTIVVALPKRALLPDLYVPTTNFTFTDRQLRSYGAFELQILEEVLRRPPSRETTTLHADVADRIRARIEYATPLLRTQATDFLTQFYAAQRNHLEREQLFGRLKESKEA
jgi:uncharacterized RDD family membrane protein YckC